MIQKTKPYVVVLLVMASVFSGCHPMQPFYFHDDGDLSHYLDSATQVEHPDYDQPRLAEVEQAMHPFVVSNPDVQEMWDLTLEECVGIALQNSKVIRNAGSIQGNFGFSDALIGRVTTLSTIFDPSITESQTSGQTRLVGASGNVQAPSGGIDRSTNPTGVEDALSDFDAQPFVSGTYNKTDRPQNFAGAFAAFQPSFFQQNDSDFTAAISKKSAFGNVTTFRSRTDFNWNNQSLATRPIPGDWISSLEIEGIVPLGRGSGVQINRLPIMLARINTDISIADFEAAVRNLLLDVETAYWDLHFSFRNLEAARIGRDTTRGTWNIIHEKNLAGAQGGEAQAEAQARGQFFQFRASAESALRDLYSTENRLRWLMGLASTDGRLIRPKDAPTVARVDFQWHDIHAEALFKSAELRQQKWRIKQRELELVSARNQLLPQINATWLYRWLGRGDELMNASRNGLNFPTPGSTAFDELFEGDYQEASFGLTFLPPRLGARRELAGIRNAQLQLARAKAQLEEMELNQSHLMATAIRNLDADYNLAQSNLGYLIAAEDEFKANEAKEEFGAATADLVLDAQRRRAQAQVAYYQSLVNYNKSLANVHYRKGTLLDHNGIQLAEGPWPAKAYWDAVGQARQRDASYYLNYGYTRPSVVSRGPGEEMGSGVGVESHAEGMENIQRPQSGVPSPAGRPRQDLPGPDEGQRAPDHGAQEGPQARHNSGQPSNRLRTNGKSPVVQASATQPADEQYDWGDLGLGASAPPEAANAQPNALRAGR
ncbi:MAG: TolC family protein [Planctomycetes bacterium]|nr:TolC family protein [Planctomycetota bacterium]